MGWVKNDRCSRAEGPEELAPWVRKLNLPVGLSRLLGHTFTRDNYHTSPHPRGVHPRGVHPRLAGDFSVRAKVTLTNRTETENVGSMQARLECSQIFLPFKEFKVSTSEPSSFSHMCKLIHSLGSMRKARRGPSDRHAWLSCLLVGEFFILQGANILKDLEYLGPRI